MHNVPIEDRVETYRKSKKNCLPEEYAGWVNAVDKYLDGDTNALVGHDAWVVDVALIVRDDAKVSMSDSIK